MRIFGGFVLTLVLLPFAAHAQEEEQTAYAYVTYFICDPANEARADEIVKRNYKPHYDAAVEHGDIVQWSWLAHFVGGEWRRALVLTAINIDDLLDASGALGEILEETTPEAGRVFTEVCNQHVDYIWKATGVAAGASAGDARADAGFSMYMVCDMGREDRADEIVRETIAPVYDRHVAEGNLASWTWLEHHVGGKYRRLLAVTAADHKTLMKTRDAIIAELGERRAKRAVDELNEICHTHEDYMWDIQAETP